MPVVLPTSLPPSRDDRTTFAQRGNDAWAHLFAAWPALNTLETNVNAKEVTVNAKELSATTAATNAANSAITAATSAGAAAWVSGTTYAIGDFRYSPATFAIFRRITAGAGTTDPSADATNWGGIIQPLVSGGTGASTAAAARANLAVGTATLTTNTPAGGIAATNVQAAINELDTEKYDKTGGPINGRAYTPPSILAFSATPTFDAALSNVFYLGALTGNVTAVVISNPVDGQTINIRFVQDATGGRTIVLPASVKASGEPILPASRASWLVLTYVLSAARWEGAWSQVPA